MEPFREGNTFRRLRSENRKSVAFDKFYPFDGARRVFKTFYPLAREANEAGVSFAGGREIGHVHDGGVTPSQRGIGTSIKIFFMGLSWVTQMYMWVNKSGERNCFYHKKSIADYADR